MIYGVDLTGNIIEVFDNEWVFSGNVVLSQLLGNSHIYYFLFSQREHTDISEIYLELRKEKNVVYLDNEKIMMLRSDLERMRGCKFENFDNFSNFIKRFFTYTNIKNEYNIKKSDNVKIINFYGITSTLGMPNRGPIIQTEFKKKYFRRDIEKYGFYFNTKSVYEH